MMEMAVETTFSEVLRTWRDKHGWTQKEAAFALNVDVDLYRKWEHGPNEPHATPSMGEVRKRMEETDK